MNPAASPTAWAGTLNEGSTHSYFTHPASIGFRSTVARTSRMQESNELKKSVWELVCTPNYHPLKPRQILKKLGLSPDSERLLKKTIKRMVKDGSLIWGPKHLVLKGELPQPGKGSNEITGTYQKASAGYGFVRPLETPREAERSLDVFIPAGRQSDAANGDTVRVRVTRRRQGREEKLSGKVLEVVERRTHRFVGTYLERGGYGLVQVDNNVFETAIYVGDAGAKNGRVGDKVVIEIANFPSAYQEGEGVIVEILGPRGKPGVDTQMIVHEFGLPQEFPESALESAREQAERFDETIGDNRKDFTGETVITIDPKTARDFDDAISLTALENGHWRLGVHIADVSHFVPYRSELDNEAFRRATSVYLPDKVIPMLPEIISNNLASLQPNRVRYCMTAEIEFTEDGAPVATELHRGAIKSCHRFNYEEIDDYLENDKPWRAKLTPPVFTLVRNMHTLAMKLRRRRMERGSLDLALPEVVIDLDDDGKVCGAHTSENTESHQIIEEFMLAANEAVAQRLVDEELFLMRRIHESPSEPKLRELTKFVRTMGVECENLQDRFELKRIISETAQLPEAFAIHFAILRSMQKAIYSPREIGHFALASDAYCHFTSPIRRYPDLVIHRMVGELIDGKKPNASFDRLAALGDHCSDLERRAEQAERELKKLKLLNYLADRIGEEMEAVITGVESYGLFAQGVEIPAEGLVPLKRLPPDRYEFDRTGRTLMGFRPNNQFRLGDRVRIRVAMVDLDQRQLEFDLVTKQKGQPPRQFRKGESRSQKSRSQKSHDRQPRKHK